MKIIYRINTLDSQTSAVLNDYTDEDFIIETDTKKLYCITEVSETSTGIIVNYKYVSTVDFIGTDAEILKQAFGRWYVIYLFNVPIFVFLVFLFAVTLLITHYLL